MNSFCVFVCVSLSTRLCHGAKHVFFRAHLSRTRSKFEDVERNMAGKREIMKNRFTSEEEEQPACNGDAHRSQDESATVLSVHVAHKTDAAHRVAVNLKVEKLNS